VASPADFPSPAEAAGADAPVEAGLAAVDFLVVVVAYERRRRKEEEEVRVWVCCCGR
jgi:hypothetical protein